MEQRLETRRAGQTDIPALVALVNSAYRGESSKAGWATEADLLDGIRIDAERLATELEAEGSVVLVHEDEGAIVACVHLERTGDSCYLGMLTTKPTLQARGLGRQMLAAAEAWAVQAWGTREMHMTVIMQRESLIAWYERRGYVRTGETKPFPYGDERWGLPKVDDLAFVVLSKRLDSLQSPL
ncbi:MAG: GNAT family N-acetyltransferase [Vicinamibacterales bacterium]